MSFLSSETICASSTAPGIGGIAVIRISGENAFVITDKIFSKSISEVESHTVHFGKIIQKDKSILDEVLVTV